MPHYSRNQRVQEAYQQEVARILSYELDDPRLEMATVTAVEVSKDLSEAKVFVSCLSDNEEDENGMMQALESARGYIKRLLAHRLVMRKLPDPHFRLDRSAKRAFRIFGVLEKLREEEPVEPEAGEAHDAETPDDSPS